MEKKKQNKVYGGVILIEGNLLSPRRSRHTEGDFQFD